MLGVPYSKVPGVYKLLYAQGTGTHAPGYLVSNRPTNRWDAACQIAPAGISVVTGGRPGRQTTSSTTQVVVKSIIQNAL